MFDREGTRQSRDRKRMKTKPPNHDQTDFRAGHLGCWTAKLLSCCFGGPVIVFEAMSPGCSLAATRCPWGHTDLRFAFEVKNQLRVRSIWCIKKHKIQNLLHGENRFHLARIAKLGEKLKSSGWKIITSPVHIIQSLGNKASRDSRCCKSSFMVSYQFSFWRDQ